MMGVDFYVYLDLTFSSRELVLRMYCWSHRSAIVIASNFDFGVDFMFLGFDSFQKGIG